MTSVVNKVGNMETKIKSHVKALKMLTYMSVDIEWRSRRKNLIFRGFFEHKVESVYGIILDFLDYKLEFDLQSNPIVIDRANSLGKSK